MNNKAIFSILMLISASAYTQDAKFIQPEGVDLVTDPGDLVECGIDDIEICPQ